MLRGKIQGWTRVSASAGVTSTKLDAEVRPERPELPVTPARLRSLREKGPEMTTSLAGVVSRTVNGASSRGLPSITCTVSVKLPVGWQTSRAAVCSGEAKVTTEENVVTVQIPERMRSCVVEL